jgi:hypothetical protein
MKTLRNNEKGAAVIEFAILLLLLIPLVFGIIEFGFLWAQSHYLSQAAREGARAGARIAVSDSGNITNLTSEVQPVVETTVRASLKTAPFYTARMQEILGVNGISTSQVQVLGKPALEVSVTVNSDKVWPPMLWQLLSLIPPFDKEHSEIRTLTDSAVFAISGH